MMRLAVAGNMVYSMEPGNMGSGWPVNKRTALRYSPACPLTHRPDDGDGPQFGNIFY